MLAQIRLAWWREMFGRPASDWPAGEPLLAQLAAWDAERAGLAALADGWEAMSKNRETPRHVSGWAAGDTGSLLADPKYQRLEGPWVDGKDPAV